MNLADGLRQLARMCGEYSCADCPLRDIGFCGVEIPDRSVDVNKMAAAIIEKWAEENPEPIYPTWIEYLIGIGIIPNEIRLETADALMDTHLLKPIPADIAQKLGLQPKEG